MEELSRIVEYLQLVAAAAVDRTRKQSAAAAGAARADTSWTTGWRESPGGWETGGSGTAEPAGTCRGRRRGRRHARYGGCRRHARTACVGGAGVGAG